MAKRLDEFRTFKRIECGFLYLYAQATYKRGDIPDVGEYEYISERVKDKFPKAELRQMKRIIVPTGNMTIPFNKVVWEFEWVVYNYNKESKVE